MSEREWLAERFEAHRARLRSVAYRMLGSSSEAEDAVQEAWLRLSRNDNEIENLGGWLTTAVARVCLDVLRSRTTRREEPIPDALTDEIASEEGDPEREALLADSLGPALLVVLDTLTPGERLAFVLHDLFTVPFDEIATIVGRSPTAARQLASRGRRRVRGAVLPDPDRERQREIVDAFLAASRGGDFQALVALLDPDVVLRGDEAVVRIGGTALARGARSVAETFAGRARGAQPALIGGMPGLAWAPQGDTRVAFAFRVERGKIVSIDMLADREHIRQLNVTLLSRASARGDVDASADRDHRRGQG